MKEVPRIDTEPPSSMAEQEENIPEIIMSRNAKISTSHKAWEMTEDEFQKTPDIRLFDVKVTEEDKTDLLDYFADIARRVREDDPPLPILSKWRFNSYKNAISESLTDDEMERLEMVNGFLKEAQPVWMQKQMDMALNDIKRRREAIKDVT